VPEFVLLTKFHCGEKIKEYEIVSFYSIARGIKNTYKALVGQPRENRIQWKSRRRWVGNIVMYLQERRCKPVYWIYFAQIKD
jgi:hypothetical protein